MNGRAIVLRGDARALPLPDASVDLVVTSPPYYCRLAQWRITNPPELAKAMRVEKPEPVHRDQLNLFDLAEVAP